MATWKPSPNYTPGRSHRVQKIIIHWMVGTLASTDATFANRTSQVSAHYGIENRVVHQYVKESDTAWHAKQANPFSIGIEHSAAPGRAASNSTYETTISLCANICGRYGLNPDTAIEPHNKYVVTQCPGTVDLNRIKAGVKAKLQGGLVIEEQPPVFNTTYYLKANPDVARAKMSAKTHWLKYGIKEGRASAPNFHVKEYIANYADLRKAFGTNYAKAVKHYYTTGINENRSGRKKVAAQAVLQVADLKEKIINFVKGA